MATHTCVQGDNYSYDFTSKSFPSFDVNWTGIWAIVDKLGVDRTNLATGLILPSTDTTKMEMRILPADTSNIDPGFYILVAQLTNTTIGFNKEVMQDEFEITDQGA